MHLENSTKVVGWMKYVWLTSSLSLFLLIVFGGILRASGPTGICTEWPACFGIWHLAQDINSTEASIYRFLSLVAGFSLASGAILAYMQYRLKRPAWSSYLAAFLFSIQILLDRILFVSGDVTVSTWLPGAQLGIYLIILSLLTHASMLLYLPALANLRPLFSTRFAKLSLASLVILLLSFISGAVVSSSGAPDTCNSWPLCERMINPVTLSDWVNLIHRASVLLAGFLLTLITASAWRYHRNNSFVMVTTTSAFVLFFSQAILASQMVGNYPAYQFVLHQSAAVAVWVTLFLQVAYVSAFNVKSEESYRIVKFKDLNYLGKAKDFLMLTKPIVVALLLVTTYAGMVIGGKELPALSTTFWTLLGGFMAAGGSGAINQYIDRFDDFKMQRTQKRPIPSGRLTPEEGLSFGIAMAIGSFFIMVAFVNLPAALLTLAGIFYYVFIYSIFLKKTTVQNIVIGGGAGAIPPLVGWAAVTGGLNIPSLFLFAVVFMWTPPHFWALALVRRNDYARAGVPMLPVVRGEKEARWQIFLYTIELFGLTLLLPIFGLGGSIYLIGAVILGLWLLSAAWRVWKQGGNKSAWKMYRYSSMYLAFLFMALMLDALV